MARIGEFVCGACEAYNFLFRHMPTERIEKLRAVKQPPPPAGPKQPVADAEEIRVRGARVHNLKNIDFTIPHNAFPQWFWQVVLLSSALGLLAEPLKTQMREHDDVIAHTSLTSA